MLEEIKKIKTKITDINAEKIKLEANKESTAKELKEDIEELESFNIKPETAEKVIEEKEKKLRTDINNAKLELEKIEI